ncbi:MAG: TrmH family RNA methyltransferase [Egibacteraceae bacterium]
MGEEIGVGPWEGPWPDSLVYDEQLLREGDRRNVVDRYRYWSVAAIRADLVRRAHSFHVAIENFQHDFNIGAVVRNANAFLAAGVHIIGERRWNRRGAMMTEVYQQIVHHATLEDFATWARDRGLPVVGIDNLPGAVPIDRAEIPPACVLLFGQEGPGLSPGARALADEVMAMRQFGSTRSINAGAASAIAMHEWVRRHVP